MILGSLMVSFIGIFDLVTGPEISFAFLYLFPIYLVTWFGGRRSGIVLSFASAIIGVIVNEPSPLFSNISFWNVSVRLGFFVIIVLLETKLKDIITYAKTDPLTSIGNRRYFFEEADLEIKMLARYKRPFTVVYIDISNFNAINDNFGRAAGDGLLKAVSQTLRNNIRTTDIFARLSGNVFIILLHETDTEAARKVIPKLHELLNETAKENKGPASFSIGVVTFIDPPGSVDEMIKMIVNLMCSATKSDNNLIKYYVFNRKLLGEER